MTLERMCGAGEAAGRRCEPCRCPAERVRVALETRELGRRLREGQDVQFSERKIKVG